MLVYVLLATAGVAFNIIFWQWWVQPDHVVTWTHFIVVSLALSYDLTIVPAFVMYFLLHMKIPVPIPADPDLKVVMATAIVPSTESIDVLEETLAGMVAVHYPHDNWVLDEGGDPRVRALCDRYGVHYWSRKGIPCFNQSQWPFQAKTKSGNYNSWFTSVAYDRYEFLVQLDSDHIPVPSYLDDVLGYFKDPEVAYVALPSVYRNMEDWTTRGSSEQNQIFNGLFQMGCYGLARTPLIVGSHAVYRLSHLKEIGGFAPSRAEDHLDTLRLAQRGHQGVFVPKVLAMGLGPHNLADYLAQDHQWAFSMTQILLKYGRQRGNLSREQRTIFLTTQLWYPIFALVSTLLYLIPIVALVSGHAIVKISLLEFIAYAAPMPLVLFTMLMWIFQQRWLRPTSHFPVSWRGMILAVARWPIVLVAIVNAVISLVFRQGRFNYGVTPKGVSAISMRHALQTSVPFVLLAIFGTAVTIGYSRLGWDPDGDAAGYVMFCLAGVISLTMVLIAAGIDFVHANIRSGVRRSVALARSMSLTSIAILLLSSAAVSLNENGRRTETALLYIPKTAQVATPAPRSTAESVFVPPTPTVTATAEPTATVVEKPTPQPLSAVSSWLFDPEAQGVTFGAYDPSGQLSGISGLDHYFVAWADDATGGVPTDQIQQSYSSGIPVLLTVEPWPLDGRSTSTLLTDIAGGAYDPVIWSMATTLRTSQQPILIRFGHEMNMQGLYPWAQNDPSAYIAAYRHVVNLTRSIGATNVLWVWSPGAQSNVVDYYPGASYVDYTGVSILEYTRWEIDLAGVTEPRPFVALINDQYNLLEPLGKPLILAEVGIDLDPSAKTDRIKEMIETLPNFPEIRGVVYFDDQNPGNKFDQDRPEWALSADDVTTLWITISQSPWMEQQSTLIE